MALNLRDLGSGLRKQKCPGWSVASWHPQPSRKTGVDGQSGRRDAGVPHKEILYRRQFTQALSYGDADDAKHKTEW
jgi:hypothetical protein